MPILSDAGVGFGVKDLLDAHEFILALKAHQAQELVEIQRIAAVPVHGLHKGLNLRKLCTDSQGAQDAAHLDDVHLFLLARVEHVEAVPEILDLVPSEAVVRSEDFHHFHELIEIHDVTSQGPHSIDEVQNHCPQRSITHALQHQTDLVLIQVTSFVNICAFEFLSVPLHLNFTQTPCPEQEFTKSHSIHFSVFCSLPLLISIALLRRWPRQVASQARRQEGCLAAEHLHQRLAGQG
mmetsp:Transcript_11915/g.19615  ORF Transcript_11915/g.19615 Transcript_11915/m.19615 type:complete len:237 (+) Transcript_11915:835-1545(+)